MRHRQRWTDGLAAFFGRRVIGISIVVGVFLLVGQVAKLALA
jgi:hypothetical protein